MATAQGQDIVCCQLCPNPVEQHCNFCHVDLCPSCIAKHMADKSREHEVVGYTSRKEETIVLPRCSKHENKRCETYCQDCKIPICIQCVLGLHRKHEFTDINDILKKQKQQIIADTEELENAMVPKYRNVHPTTTAAEYDKVVAAIEEQEGKICKAVHEAGIQLKDEVSKQRDVAVRKSREIQSLNDKAEKKLNEVIKKNKDILKSNDASVIINYKSRNEDFKVGPELPRVSYPQLFSGYINEDQILKMYGFLQTEDEVKKRPGSLRMIKYPAVISTIQSPYGSTHELWRLQCRGRDKILISGNDKTIKEIDSTGCIIQTIQTNDDVRVLTINLRQEPVFSSITWVYKEIYIFNNSELRVLYSIPDWLPVGLCYTGNGDLLVSVRSKDRKQSRIVKYSGIAEIQKIQFDCQGKPLFSIGAEIVLLLTENGNGDICVADYAGNAVVVVDSSGRLRFKYEGNLLTKTKFTKFTPSKIAADVNTNILISDNSIVHIIDCDGNFVRYIEHPCNGGLSIDTDHNLVIGDKNTGKIQIIKYLE
ncbi:E3 ubiquitin-protein ligase Trim36-like [Saccostrea echinata]|uniref:E3 ubiquitin-protein ligase Trim36-like n=1 Tax=Saccostrea echinata TaxID=191078 RepID=UPI002A7FBA4E|nr:E3 ubiquitin-protein ligase Trim36-like [Saccostrea echinata]